MSTFLLKKIAEHQTSLEQHRFCQHLRQREDISSDAYRFIPSMTFFVLGFRDILETVKIDNPVSECELALNAHCEEDAEHWRWFIEDLHTLQMDTDYWGGSVGSILSNIWSPTHYPVRALTYRIISYIHNTQSPEEKMLIMECLESTFSVFITSLNTITQKNGDFNRLKFFGTQHYEAEAEHSGGNWLDGEKPTAHDHFYHIEATRVRSVNQMIDTIFAGFDEMFHCWADTLNIDVQPLNVGIINTREINQPASLTGAS
ncbi:hypothetical protein ACVBE9_11925 [Eionea flava]